MTEAELLSRMVASLQRFVEVVAAGADNRLVAREGVRASVVPAAPDRSVFNSVAYDYPEPLAVALPELAAAYDEAGVRAWTVWVPEADAATRELLAAAGHARDAAPRAMARELAGVRPPEPGALDWERVSDVGPLAELNADAYGAGEQFVAGCAGFDADRAHLYLARLDGRPAASVACVDHDGDCGVYLVATAEAARRRGLASGLLRQALADAAARGATTTSLQATKPGAPVYARLGYRDLGAIEMWERRRPREG